MAFYFLVTWVVALWAYISPYIPWPSIATATPPPTPSAQPPAPTPPPPVSTPVLLRSHVVSAEELEHARAEIESGVLTTLNNSQLPEHERRMGGISIIKWNALADGSMRFALSTNSLAYEQALYRALLQQKGGGLALTVIKGNVTVDAHNGPGKQVVTTLSLMTPRAAATSISDKHSNGRHHATDMTACELFRFLAIMTGPILLLYWLLV